MRGLKPSMELAVALVLAALLVGVATVSGPYFVSAVGTSLLEDELTASGDRIVLVRVGTSSDAHPDALRDADAALRDEIADLGLPEPELQVVAHGATLEVDGERRDGVNLLGRPGGDDELPDVLERGPGLFAVDESSARRLGLTGDEEVALAGPDGTTEPLLGPVVEEFERRAVPPFWQPVSGLLTSDDDPRTPPPPPALIGDTDDVLDAVASVDTPTEPDPETDPGPVQLAATWEVLPDGVPTLEEAQALLPRIELLRQAAVDPTSDLGGDLASASQGRLSGGQPIATGQLSSAVVGTEAATAALAVPVTALGIAGQLIGLAGVAVATVLGGRRELSRARLWVVRGVSASTLGARWGLGAILPVVFGVGAGWGVADLLARSFGPGRGVDSSVRAELWPQLAASAGVAVVLVAVVAGFAAASAGRERAAARRVPAVGEAALVVTALAAWWQVDTGGGPVTVHPDGTVDLDLLAVALPLLLVVAAAAIGVRALRALLQRAPASGTAWFLASRRLRSLGGARLGLMFLTAASFGVLVAAVTLGHSANATVEDKTGVLVGADASIQLSRSITDLETERLDVVAGPTTMVRRVPDALLGERVDVEILAVDPDTFAEVAYEPAGLADDLSSLLSPLAEAAPAGGATPAILVGASLNRPTTLQVQDVTIDVDQVAAVSVFPGMSGERPLVVIPDDGALDGGDDAAAARLATGIWPELWVGADPDPDELATQLGRADIDGEATFASQVRQAPGLAPVRWTFAYLQGQATVIAALGLLALLAYHVAGQRRQALGTILARRMGLTRRARVAADLTELGILLGVAALVGAGSGLLSARTILADYDPMPEVAIPAVFALPSELFPVVGAIGVVGVAGAVALTVRITERIDVATLLRGDP